VVNFRKQNIRWAQKWNHAEEKIGFRGKDLFKIENLALWTRSEVIGFAYKIIKSVE